MDVLRIENLIKNYGKTRVLDGISFSIHSGEIVGFVGKNVWDGVCTFFGF